MARPPSTEQHEWLEGQIRACLPSLPYEREWVCKDDIISQGKLEELADALATNAYTRPWSFHPRTYAVLRLAATQGEDVASPPWIDDGQLAADLSDYSLPYTEETLPSIIKEHANIHRRFVQLQKAIESTQEEMGFGEADKIDLHRVSMAPPFKTDPSLAMIRGSFGQVESVRNKHSNILYARKSMVKMREESEGKMSEGEAREDRRWRLKHFKNELDVVSKLDHRHLVKFCGSYTDRQNFALLLQPVAERTLHDVLVEPEVISDTDKSILLTSFGCLAFGLAWLHSRRIRHKDIKPANILITKDGSVLFCDFGSALDAEYIGTTETAGVAQKRTPRYISPETARREPRDEASDIWSLGCVFLEVLTTLSGLNVDDLLDFIHDAARKSNSAQDICYWMGADGGILADWISQLMDVPDLQSPSGWTEQMLATEPHSRPSATELVQDIQAHHSNRSKYSHIRSCCASSALPVESQLQSQLTSPRRSSPHPIATSPPLRASPPRSPTTLSVQCVQAPDLINSVSTTQQTSKEIDQTGRGMRVPEESHEIESVGPSETGPTRGLRSEAQHSGRAVTEDSSAEELERKGSKIFEVNGESRVGTLVFSGRLATQSLQVSAGNDIQQEELNSYGLLHLYKLKESDVALATWRLVFSTPDDASVADLVVWLPLADTSIERAPGHLQLSWPDCDSLHIDEPVNGRTGHWKIFRRTEPNNTIVIHFAEQNDAGGLARILHTPIDDSIPLDESPFSYCTIVRPERFSKAGETEQPPTPTEVPHAVYFFNTPATEGQAERRGFFVRGKELATEQDEAASTAHVYWLPTCVDINLTNESTTGPGIDMSGLLMADYQSDIQDVHFSQKDNVGTCKSVELTACHTEWYFGSLDDRHAFLERISEWSLPLIMGIKSLRSKGRFRWSRHGSGDMLFWVDHSTGTAAISFRLGEAEPGKPHWITGYLPKAGASTEYGDADVKIRLESYYKGTLLCLRSMQAASASDTDEEAVSLDGPSGTRMKTVEVEFYGPQDKNVFQYHVADFYSCHGDVRNRHISVSSESNGRRSSGLTESYHSISSSSRRS